MRPLECGHSQVEVQQQPQQEVQVQRSPCHGPERKGREETLTWGQLAYTGAHMCGGSKESQQQGQGHTCTHRGTHPALQLVNPDSQGSSLLP